MLGVIGFGCIGQEIVCIGFVLGMNVMLVDIFVDEVDIDINFYYSDKVCLFVKVEIYEMDEMLVKVDIIMLYVFFVGKFLVGLEEMVKVKDGVILINVVCGGMVDEEVFVVGLVSGKVGGVGLDVFENEFILCKELLQYLRVFVMLYIGVLIVEV